LIESVFGDGHGGHGFGPSGVEREVGDGFDELLLGGAVVLRAAEVVGQLFGASAGEEAGDGDEAALLRGEFWASPALTEEDVVGEVWTSAGAKSPNIFWAPDGSLVSGMPCPFAWWLSG
jgi:hypothetical protein